MSASFSYITDAIASKSLRPGTKVLFATFPADGHFNPLTGLAMHLKSIGCDVRWYTSKTYAEKLSKLGIQHYPLKKALDITGDNIDTIFPERKQRKSQLSKLKFDIIHVFVLRAPEYFDDVQDIYQTFPFELVISDIAFTAAPIIKEKMPVPVVTMGIMPLMETSKDLPPAGMAMLPSYSFWGRKKQHILRYISDKVLFKKPYQVLSDMLGKYNIQPEGNLFDTIIRKSDLLLQSGTPGFEYFRSDLGKNIRYIGPLLPYVSNKHSQPWYDDRLSRYDKVILVTQGTVEKDIHKIIVPTLEAFKNSDCLVVVTTGGSGTQELKIRYSQENIIIEDFIPFSDIMPYADVYVTNGGYGGVMLGIQNQLPMVVAGIHEGKNEICARIGYFKLGINLKTERPLPTQIKKAVEEILSNVLYKNNVIKMCKEFSAYNPNELSVKYISELLHQPIQMIEDPASHNAVARVLEEA